MKHLVFKKIIIKYLLSFNRTIKQLPDTKKIRKDQIMYQNHIKNKLIPTNNEC